MTRSSGFILGGLFLYLFAIFPGRRKRKPDTKYYAHRGLHKNRSDAPENSMLAFARACEAGYGIELDVQLSKDGEVVVFHDSSLKRACGIDGNVGEYTWEELSQFPLFGSDQRIPRFRDVLDLVDGRVPLLVELKFDKYSSELCEKTDALLSGYRGIYSVESFHPAALIWYRFHRPEITRGQLSMNFERVDKMIGPGYFALHHLLSNFLAKPDFIAFDIRDSYTVSRRLCRDLFGCPSIAWTVKSEKQEHAGRGQFDSFIFEGYQPKKAV